MFYLLNITKKNKKSPFFKKKLFSMICNIIPKKRKENREKIMYIFFGSIIKIKKHLSTKMAENQLHVFKTDIKKKKII